MKKIASFAVALLLVVISSFALYWFGFRDASQNNPPQTKTTSPPAAKTARGTAAVEDMASSPPGSVQISDTKQQVAGIRVTTVKKVAESHTLRILGRVAADETRVYRINAAVDGWIREIADNSTGSLVRKDQILATFYSSEFLGAQQAYLYALGSMDRTMASSKEPPQQMALTAVNIRQARDQLNTIGMTDLQIEEITKSRQHAERIQIRAPATGFVTLRNVSPGQRFDKGTEFYRITDLGHVWILADLYQNEARYIQPGMTVKATLPEQGKTLTARVSRILPQFDPASRTLKVRLEADNPGYLLRPDMFVDVELPVAFPPAITVPVDAVLDLGKRRTVFVAIGEGRFEPRQVETGWRFGGRVEIVKGLKPGERIAVSGNFLIDSESKMELAASGQYGDLARDPVCGVEVATRKAEKTGRTSVFGGKAYYFSSSECKRQFDSHPDRYVDKPVKRHD